jgi:hypothetical protein
MSIQHLSHFYVPWTAALAASATEPAAPLVSSAPLVLHFQGLNLPVVQMVLAIAGVLMARPLARKREAALPLAQFLVVTAIMLVVALAWVATAPANVLFTFVVAIGLGFSGYSLIETAGDEMRSFVTRIIAQATSMLKIGGKE